MGRISLGGLSSGMDTDSMIKELMKAHSMKVDRYKKKNVMMDYRQEEWKKMNNKIYSFYNKELTNFRVKGNMLKHSVSSSNSSVATVNADAGAQSGTHELEILELAKTANTASGKLQTDSGVAIDSKTKMSDLGLAGKELKISYQGENGSEEIVIVAEGDDTLEKFASKIRTESKGKLDMEANADIKNGYLFLATKNTGEKQSFTLSGDVAVRMGFRSDEVKGISAKYKYNNMAEVFTSETNQIEVNGIKASLKAVGKTTVSVERNVEESYKQIIDFFKKYNALVTEMQDKVNVTVARNQRDMQPLLDEEKKALSEADVKKWEETLRGRVFKNDRNIKNILQDMRTSFAGTVENNGKYNALSSIGIGTGEFREGTGALLFVDGDADLGGRKAGLPNKLKAALEEDPEAVSELVSKLAQDLSDKLANRMKGTTLRSYTSFYDDKAAREENKQIERRILEMEEKLSAQEERYRKQFIAMEKAMAKANSQSGWLSQQFSKM